MNAKHASADFRKVKSTCQLRVRREPGREYYSGYTWSIEHMAIKETEIAKRKKVE